MARTAVAGSLLLAYLFTSTQAKTQATQLVDDDGRVVKMDRQAARIATLAPSLTELVFAAGSSGRLVGVSAYSDFPPAASSIPVIADATGVSWEGLIAMKPDMVLAWKGGTRPADIARLDSLGIKVFVIEVKRLEDVPRALKSIGRIAGTQSQAEKEAATFLERLREIREAQRGKDRIDVFVEISSKPLLTVNRDHVISEMVSLCGGVNVFADAPVLVSEPSRESLLSRNPEAVLYGKSPLAVTSETESYAGLPAVKAGRSYGITADNIFRPGPRLLLATAEICDALDRGRSSRKLLK